MGARAGHEFVGAVWVSQGKLYERQPDGSIQCWTDEPGLHGSDPVETLELADGLTCDVRRYQVLEAYINNEPLCERLNRHENCTGPGPTKPPSIDPGSVKVIQEEGAPKLALVHWAWSQGDERGGYGTFEEARKNAQKEAKKTEPVRIAVFAGANEIERIGFGWTDQGKLIPE